MADLTPPPSPCRLSSQNPCRLSSPCTNRLSSLSYISPPSRLSSPTRDLHPIPDRHFSITKRRRNETSRSRLLLLKIESARLRIEDERLKEENAQLKEESARSSAENACWREQVDHLHEENGRLGEENFHLREGDANANLKGDNSRLRQKLRLQEPLVRVGVCIRRRFLEKARQERMGIVGVREHNFSLQ